MRALRVMLEIKAEGLEGICWVFGCDHFSRNENLESLDRTLNQDIDILCQST